MKQIEKLDLILKSLYEKPGQSGEVVQLLKEKGIDVTLDDAHKLGRRLADAGFVKFVATRDSAVIDMKSEGIEFVEGDSFTHKGQPVINNNYTISNSPNANLINQSSHININQNSSGAKQLIEEIKERINKDSAISTEKKQEIVECLQEVEEGVKGGRAPKYAFKSLIELSADMASVASLVIQLGQLIGLTIAAS